MKMPEPIRWKNIHEFPLYQISEEGQVRLCLDHPQYPGHIKRRYKRIYSPGGSFKQVSFPKCVNMRGTFFVDMTQGTLFTIGGRRIDKTMIVHSNRRRGGSPRFSRSIANLMDTHWPGLPYPEDWRVTKRWPKTYRKKLKHD